MIVLQDERALIELVNEKLTIWLPKRDDQTISNSRTYNRDNNLDYIEIITDLQGLGFNNDEIQLLFVKLEQLDV